MPASKENIEQVKDTIRKMLNLAKNDAAADGEIRNALAFAQKMMAQYHLSESDIKEIDPHTIEHINVDDLNYTNQSNYATGKKICSWESYLANFVCNYVGSVVAYIDQSETIKKTSHGTIDFDSSGNTQYKQRIVFNGPENDTFLAQNLFDEIALTISCVARMKFGGHLRGKGRSYGDGFVTALLHKLKESKRLLLMDPTGRSGTALIVRAADQLVERKKEATHKYLKKNNIRISKSASTRKNNFYGDAYSEGQSDGKNHNTDKARTNYDRNARKRLS